jgi:hypothetical protein
MPPLQEVTYRRVLRAARCGRHRVRHIMGDIGVVISGQKSQFLMVVTCQARVSSSGSAAGVWATTAFGLMLSTLQPETRPANKQQRSNCLLRSCVSVQKPDRGASELDDICGEADHTSLESRIRCKPSGANSEYSPTLSTYPCVL